uniref:Secreted protein n=1 Tax=Utricularia reniformis TaxID=192314 RepID=A0A1Y0B041_9LAMI|nr:hypothetical protein AEK19_MT0514 [Utricularia reniformis]ART30770.1 hypothetical protein AEK19_MT0514 [Utricularia reniformis]
MRVFAIVIIVILFLLTIEKAHTGGEGPPGNSFLGTNFNRAPSFPRLRRRPWRSPAARPGVVVEILFHSKPAVRTGA